MTYSTRLASIMGAALIALAVTEPRNWAIVKQQSTPVVYLNGTILFVTGIALVRTHNLGSWDGPRWSH